MGASWLELYCGRWALSVNEADKFPQYTRGLAEVLQVNCLSSVDDVVEEGAVYSQSAGLRVGKPVNSLPVTTSSR